MNPLVSCCQTEISNPDDLYKLNITAPHGAGLAIFKQTYPFWLFMISNSMIFLSSMAVMVVLFPPSEFVGWTLAGFSLFLYYCYFSSLIIITNSPGWTALIVLFSPLIFLIVGAFVTSLDQVELLNAIVPWRTPKSLTFICFFFFSCHQFYFLFSSLNLDHPYQLHQVQLVFVDSYMEGTKIYI